MPENAPTLRRFAVALSFAGDDGNRAYVMQVAEALLKHFNRERIFFDEWHLEEIAGFDSELKLQHVYGEDADIIVPFFCKHYVEKNWTRAELHPIRELLFEQKSERVFPFRFDMTKVPGTFKQDIFPLVTGRSPEDIAGLIVKRYNRLFPSNHEPEPVNMRADIDRITRYAPAQLIGREMETKLLDDAWAQARNDEQ
jgi:hypothetical protein